AQHGERAALLDDRLPFGGDLIERLVPGDRRELTGAFGADALQRRQYPLGRIDVVGVSVDLPAGKAGGVGMVGVALDAHHLAVLDMGDQRAHVGAIVRTDDANLFHASASHLPHPEERREATRLEGWATPRLDPTLRDARLWRAPQGEGIRYEVYQRRPKRPALLLLGGALSRGCLGGLGAGRLGAGGDAGAGHAEAVLEALHAAAAVDALAHAGPGRMGLRIDIQAHLRAFLAPGRLRLERRAVGHHHRDLVVVGVGLLFHRLLLRLW